MRATLLTLALIFSLRLFSQTSVCGTYAELMYDTIGTGVVSGYWTSSIPGILINQSGAVPFYSTVDASGIPNFFVNSMQTVWFYWHYIDIQSLSYMDSISVTFYEMPSGYNFPDSSVCGLSYGFEGNMSIDNSMGHWSVFSGTGNTASVNGVSPDDNVSVQYFGVYSFVWKEMNAGNTSCYSTDTVNIDFLAVPMSYAGADTSVCSKWVQLHAHPTVPGGQWSGPSGIAFYSNINDSAPNMNARYNPDVWVRWASENDTVSFYWTEFNGTCYGYDTVNVYFGSVMDAVVTSNPADSVFCGSSYTLYSKIHPAYGYGYWVDSIVSTQFISNFSDTLFQINYSFDALINDFGPHHFYWITVNGNCRDTSDAFYVNFKNNGFVKGNISGMDNSNNFKAQLFKSNPHENSPYSAIDANGNYFIDAETGNYYLKAEKLNPSLSQNIASTYYGDTWKWDDAVMINLQMCDTLNADINMYQFNNALGGTCRAFGTIMYDNGGSVENTNVYLLYKPSNLPAMQVLTNSNGYYSLNDIPAGNYKIQVDIPGLPQVTTHHITVNPFDTLFPNVNFIVDTTQIAKDYGFGIYADTLSSVNDLSLQKMEIHVFPNPFENELYLNVNESFSGTLEWLDEKGIIIKNDEIEFNKGINKLSVPENLSSKICFIKIDSKNTVYVKKLIRK